MSIPAPREHRREEGQRDEDQPGALEVDPGADRDDRGHHHLDDAGAEVSPGSVEAQALPFSASGKKNEMLVIEEAKLPPPKPARAAQASSTPKDVSGCVTTQASAAAGSSRSSAEMMVQLRPPKTGTAKV